MDEWVKFFNDPSDQTRGLMVAAQTFGSFIVSNLLFRQPLLLFFRISTGKSGHTGELTRDVTWYIIQTLLIAPLFSDGIGRRKTLCLGSTIMCGGVILQAMSTGTAHFVASRIMGESLRPPLSLSHLHAPCA
jgi:hypothetical protein